MTRFISQIRSLPASVWATYKAHPRKSTAGLIVVVVATVLLFSGGDTAEAPANGEGSPSVTVASVAALSAQTEPLVLLGEVRSVSQAELRAQKPGEVTQVYATAGQFVPAGAILAEINNAAERAAVLSAQGTLAAAEAQRDKTVAGARSEDRASASAQNTSATIALQSAEESARSAYSQAYSLAQDAIFAQADDFFSNTYTVNPSFRVRSASYEEKQVLEAERIAIGELLDTWKANTSSSMPVQSLDQSLATAQNDLERIKAFLNQISSFISEQELNEDLTSSDKAAQEAVILGARSSVDAARSAVGGARTSLAAAQSGAQVASLSESTIETGARPEDLAAAEANVTQARGALASAYAALENSLIRTPISGTVATLNVARGDFVSSLAVVAVVANEGALEIEAYVSDTARERISVGMPALIDGTYAGTITSAAPGLDPTTKKARITVGLTDDAPLVNGAFVEVLLEDGVDTVADTTVLMVPIAAIKVLPRGFVVFTVNDENVLEAHPISEGPIVGTKMQVPDGLTPDMRIVTDVRGFKEGDKVETEQSTTPSRPL